ncbi:hypothetical protein RHMOL_Rhmol04G0342000 [Rhododendron molle]|uniref:Uncharacterized protein n=1 Tax=Rhododendron molle TaxID=49168 RepID=A0ACC0P8X9_RHOML|nr:hypothetical protein RHMOL_Rhmol04G0342000 [Rhododendron molle]
MERGFSHLPHEIIFDILSRLPVKSLCRFKSVSRSWLALITHTHFIKSHLNHQSADADNMTHKIILASQHSGSLHPMHYPEPEQPVAELKIPDLDTQFSYVMSGLGYDATSDDFKVVAGVFTLSDDFCVVHVFSSKLSSWKSIGDFGYSNYFGVFGSVLNGAPHWFVRGNADEYYHIIYFDFMEEKFKEVPKPIYEVKDDHFYLGVLGEWLCVVDHSRESHSDVWVMMEYGVKESWTKLFVVPKVAGGEFFFQYFELLGFTKGGEVIMKLNLGKLVIYNPKQNTYKKIGIPHGCKQFDVALYVESLFSPHGCNDTRSPTTTSNRVFRNRVGGFEWIPIPFALFAMEDTYNNEVLGLKGFGVTELCTRLLVVPYDTRSVHTLTPLCFTKDGEMMNVIDRKRLVVYNPKE